MRPLTDEEMKLVFQKLKKFLGQNIQTMMDDKSSEAMIIFRIIGKKVYLLNDQLVKYSSVFAKEKTLHVGSYLGQISKKGKFRLGITALSILTKYTTTKVWLKNSGEQNFLYGNHVLAAHVARISDNATKYSGVITYTLSNIPLGFGVMAKSQHELKQTNPSSIFVFNQSDNGEYLRVEGYQNQKKKNNDESDDD